MLTWDPQTTDEKLEIKKQLNYALPLGQMIYKTN